MQGCDLHTLEDLGGACCWHVGSAYVVFDRYRFPGQCTIVVRPGRSNLCGSVLL